MIVGNKYNHIMEQHDCAATLDIYIYKKNAELLLVCSGTRFFHVNDRHDNE